MIKATVRKRALTVGAACIGLAAAIGVVVPALASSSPGAVRLHMGTDGKYFEYGSTQQPLTTSNCVINSPEPVIDLSGGSSKSPGLSSNGIGVKGSSSSGTPCGQIDGNESLKLARGGSLGSRQFTGVRLDLEMTGNAVVKLTLASSTKSVTYQLQTGNSIASSQKTEAGYDKTVPYMVSSGPGDEIDGCAAPNSSGPNSGPNDNCQWTVMPGFNFDTITLSTSCGTVALEGAGDFGNDPAYDTLLYLANAAPKANADSYTTNEDVPLNGNVLSNDTDADGNALTASVVTGPTHGDLTLGATGAFTYAPDENWFGTDSFSYKASDGLASSTATATITVKSVNDPPVGKTATASTDEETTVTVELATDVDSTDLTAVCTGAQGGTVVDNGDGTVDYTPPPDLNGTVTLVCTVTDDAGGSTTPQASIVVSVAATNDAPVADDDSAEVDVGSSVTIDVLANDNDVDGDELGVTDIDDVLPAGATAVPNPDGTVTYTPPSGYDGAGSFTYRATDGDEESNIADVDITVFPVLCSNETVTDAEGDVSGAFTRLTDQFECKRYALDAIDLGDEIIFAPLGGDIVSYRGVISFGSEAAPPDGEFPLFLRYDPTGGTDYQPVLWCIDPQFNGDDEVTGATLPAGESWCIASADTRGDEFGGLTTTWQVFGIDDPRFTR